MASFDLVQLRSRSVGRFDRGPGRYPLLEGLVDGAYTIVYTSWIIMNDTYIWDDDTYGRMGASGVPWQEAMFVLNDAAPVIRQHHDTVLQYTARAQQGRWLTVVSIEIKDDVYLVYDARYLEPDETETAESIIGGGG